MKEINIESASKEELRRAFTLERGENSEVNDFLSFINTILSDPNPKLTPDEILDEIMLIDSDELDERMNGKRKLVSLCLSKGARIENAITVYHTKRHAYSLLTCQECADGEAVYMYTGMYPKPYNREETGLIDYANAISHVAGLGLAASLNPVESFGGLLVPLAEPLTELITGRGLTNAANKFISQYQKQTYEIRREFAFDLIPNDRLHAEIVESHVDRNREHLDPGYKKLVKKKVYLISPEDAKKAYNFIESAITGKVEGLNYRFLGSNCADYTQKLLENGGFMENHLYDFYGFSTVPNGRIHAYHMAKTISNIFLAPYYFAEDAKHKLTQFLDIKDKPASQVSSIRQDNSFSYEALLNAENTTNHRPTNLPISTSQKRGHTGIGRSNIYDDSTSVALMMFVVGNLLNYTRKVVQSYFKDATKKETTSLDKRRR